MLSINEMRIIHILHTFILTTIYFHYVYSIICSQSIRIEIYSSFDGYWFFLHGQTTGLVRSMLVQWLSECGQWTAWALVGAMVESCSFVLECKILVWVLELVAQWSSLHEHLPVLALAWAGVE